MTKSSSSNKKGILTPAIKTSKHTTSKDLARNHSSLRTFIQPLPHAVTTSRASSTAHSRSLLQALPQPLQPWPRLRIHDGESSGEQAGTCLYVAKNGRNTNKKQLTREYKTISENPPPYIIAHPSESNILEYVSSLTLPRSD